jgi:hypothetical protein
VVEIIDNFMLIINLFIQKTRRVGHGGSLHLGYLDPSIQGLDVCEVHKEHICEELYNAKIELQNCIKPMF